MLQDFRGRLVRDGSVSFSVRVRPNAPESRLRGKLEDGSVKMDIAAPAEEGKANAELARFFAKEFGVPPSHVEIVAGGGGRRKIMRIAKA